MERKPEFVTRVPVHVEWVSKVRLTVVSRGLCGTGVYLWGLCNPP